MSSAYFNTLSQEDQVRLLPSMVSVLQSIISEQNATLTKQAQQIQDAQVEKILALLKLSEYSIAFDAVTEEVDYYSIDYEHGEYVFYKWYSENEDVLAVNMIPTKVKELIQNVIRQGIPIRYGFFSSFEEETRIISNDLVNDLNTI